MEKERIYPREVRGSSGMIRSPLEVRTFLDRSGADLGWLVAICSNVVDILKKQYRNRKERLLTMTDPITSPEENSITASIYSGIRCSLIINSTAESGQTHNTMTSILLTNEGMIHVKQICSGNTKYSVEFEYNASAVSKVDLKVNYKTDWYVRGTAVISLDKRRLENLHLTAERFIEIVIDVILMSEQGVIIGILESKKQVTDFLVSFGKLFGMISKSYASTVGTLGTYRLEGEEPLIDLQDPVIPESDVVISGGVRGESPIIIIDSNGDGKLLHTVLTVDNSGSVVLYQNFRLGDKLGKGITTVLSQVSADDLKRMVEFIRKKANCD